MGVHLAASYFFGRQIHLVGDLGDCDLFLRDLSPAANECSLLSLARVFELEHERYPRLDALRFGNELWFVRNALFSVSRLLGYMIVLTNVLTFATWQINTRERFDHTRFAVALDDRGGFGRKLIDLDMLSL